MNTIKIADLLHHIGTTDTITLENISITDLPLTPNGLIQGGLHLQSASDYRIDASMYDIQCILDTTCESCGGDFHKSIWIDEFTCIFEHTNRATSDESFPIDTHDTIALDEPLIQAITLQQPVVERCIKCINKLHPVEEDIKDSNTGGVVQFTYAS